MNKCQQCGGIIEEILWEGEQGCTCQTTATSTQPMTTPLPPEIKSAEEFQNELFTSRNEHDEVRRIAQRDLAIWNAAIEKAAEKVHPSNYDQTNGGFDAMRQSILKLKE